MTLIVIQFFFTSGLFLSYFREIHWLNLIPLHITHLVNLLCYKVNEN